MTMGLHLDVELRRERLLLRAALRVAAGETVAIVGPNGAGKSSLLLAIAGLLRVDRGRIALGERLLDGGPGGPFVPPEQRGVGVVFQGHLLFPHLTALDNVAFGLRSRGIARREARDAAARWLERVGLGAVHHGAKPAALSGGQAQRVALARTLATEPAALLLDEPLAAVDASGRLELLRELREHLRQFAGPRVVVVHDIADALAFAERVVVIENGAVVQDGAIDELVGRPRSTYVADLVGLNGFVGVCDDNHVRVGALTLTVATPVRGDVLVTIHPRAVALFRERPSGSPRNVWTARAVDFEPLLDRDRVRVRLDGALSLVAEITPAAVADLKLRDGGEVWVAVKATEIGVTPR